jgi:hypothetical protein
MRTIIGPGLLCLMLLTASPGFAGVAAFPCEDINDNGVCDAGDTDISAALYAPGLVYYATPHSIVIPARVRPLVARNTRDGEWGGWHLVAGKNITVNTSIRSAQYAGIVLLQANGGKVAIGPKVRLMGRNSLAIYASEGVTVGPGASFVSSGVSSNHGSIHIETKSGDLVFQGRATLEALREIFLEVPGRLTVAPGMAATGDRISIHAGQVSITRTTMFKAADIYIEADGTAPLTFTSNKGVAVSETGPFLIYNPGGAVDVTGTKLPLSAEIVGDPVIGQ